MASQFVIFSFVSRGRLKRITVQDKFAGADGSLWQHTGNLAEVEVPLVNSKST